MAPKNSVLITGCRFLRPRRLSQRKKEKKKTPLDSALTLFNPPHPTPTPGSFHQQHSPVFCVAKRMTRATMMMKSKETMAMRQISREVQRGFLADLGAVVSVILGSLPSGARCRPVSSPEERKRGRRLRERQSLWRSRDYFTFVTVVFRVVSEPKNKKLLKLNVNITLN